MDIDILEVRYDIHIYLDSMEKPKRLSQIKKNRKD